MQKSQGLLVERAGEVPIPPADEEEGLGGFQAHELVGVGAEIDDLVAWRDWNRQHHGGCSPRPGDVAGDASGCSRRDPVVDDDGRPSSKRAGAALAAIDAFDVGERSSAVSFELGQVACAQPGEPNHPLVDVANPALADGADHQLGPERRAQLADDDHVEGSRQRPGHLDGDRDAAPRHTQDDDVLTSVVPEAVSQAAPGVSTI
jgi:hypothetical protein